MIPLRYKLAIFFAVLLLAVFVGLSSLDDLPQTDDLQQL